MPPLTANLDPMPQSPLSVYVASLQTYMTQATASAAAAPPPDRAHQVQREMHLSRHFSQLAPPRQG